jgi:hypothetical protein
VAPSDVASAADVAIEGETFDAIGRPGRRQRQKAAPKIIIAKQLMR